MPATASKDDAADVMEMATAASQELVHGKPSAASAASSGSNNTTSNTDALVRSNLLRLEMCELLKESILHINPPATTTSSSGADVVNRAHEEAKWAPTVREYMVEIQEVMESLDEATLSPSVAILPAGNNSGSDNDAAQMYRIPLLSDKFHKSLPESSSSSSSSGGGKSEPDNNLLTSWSFPFHGGSSLSLVPIGSFGHIGNAGLANRHANGGNVLPVLDVAVLVSNIDASSPLFVGGKDYLNHRYTDKRNILAVHIAKQLSQKKHRNKIGAVHLTHVFGDSRKVGLLLTPPLLDAEHDDDMKSKHKRKRANSKVIEKAKSNGGKEGGRTKKNKLRFRIRLIFGIKQANEERRHDGQQNTPSRQLPNEDSYSTDEDEETLVATATTTLWNYWIPRSRLLPNRSNNRSKDLEDHHHHHNLKHDKNSVANTTPPVGTPHYTNSIAEDLHLLSTTQLINSTFAALSTTSSSSLTPNDSKHSTPTSPFHETLLLLKVWALQRGFLRGHDTFTTTTLAILLVYLYRTKAIGKRVGCVQAFTTFMKFWSENDWLGEDNIPTSFGGGGGGSSSSSSSHTIILSNPKAVHERKAKKKSAFVIPDVGRSEPQTIAQCAQARCYLDDIRGRSNNTDYGYGGTAPPKTLLDCYRISYTSSSSFSSSIENGCHHDSPILLDPTMTLNYLARLSPSFVRESRSEAHMALRYIHGLDVEGKERGRGWAFRKLFLETNRFWTRYDAYVRVPLSIAPRMTGIANASYSGPGGVGKRKHHGRGYFASPGRVWGNDIDDIGYDESVCRSVVEVFSRALGDRTTSIRAFTSGNGNIQECASILDDAYEDVATNFIADSDQCHGIPIRGSTLRTLGFPARTGDRSPMSPALQLSDDLNESCLVIGLRIDPNNSRRIVDRGPPAEDIQGSNAFVTLWGEQHAQLRRFQDGAIVRAVVWNDTPSATDIVQFSGMDRSMGGVVERIVQHIAKLHFTDGKLAKATKATTGVRFQLRDMVSLIDGASSSQSSPFSDSLALHKNIMTAFNSLTEFLRQNSKTATDNATAKGKKASNLGLPLAVDTVEPLSPCLRYSALFPPIPHPLLGGERTDTLGLDKRKVSGVNLGSPILIQIRFEGSSKWPTSLNAMGAAKCAMLLQLADGIEKMKQDQGSFGEFDHNLFDGPIDVTPTYLDVGYRGYSWRIIVRADQELRMLRTLKHPTAEASALRSSLINRHVRSAMHHSLIHAIHTRHPSASSVVRLAHRWVASHMMSDLIPQEAIELVVAKIYTESTEKTTALVNTPPSTVVAGFIRFLHLISNHDWVREPLIVDPQNHIAAHDRALIHVQFHNMRGPEWNRGPAMYIISPVDYDTVEDMDGSRVVGDEVNANHVIPSATATEKIWAPTTTCNFPEKVVLTRASTLAKCSHDHLTACLVRGNMRNSWIAAFQESSQSLSSFSALLRVRSCFIMDLGCSSTNMDFSIPNAHSKLDQLLIPFERSLQSRFSGPTELRMKLYKNLLLELDTIHEWDPVRSLVNALRSKYNEYAVFFYNEFAPEVIAMVWRPGAFKPHPFSVGTSNFQRPVSELWKDDSFVITNAEDLMAEVEYFARDIVSNFKIFDKRNPDDGLSRSPKTMRIADKDER